nr:carbohydrate binding family 9 domain-containing protein [Pseudopedobacter sp.]
MKLLFTCILVTTIFLTVCAQTPIKTLTAKKTAVAPKIDGILDDVVWKDAPLATNFIAFQPVPGIKEDQDHKTEVYILYDDQAIYIGARMKESKAEDISTEFVNRDQIGNSDFLGIILDTYNDKINASEFIVTSAGVQLDAKISENGEDEAWDAVWESAIKINGNEWTAEIKIPYSALRFSNKDIQTWGLNFVRNRQKFQQKLTWNELDPKRSGFINQEGELLGIEKITAPLRLSFSPYLSTYVNHYPYNQAGISNTNNSLNGGMDVKYGINESFTLDLTLIPDFGQVQSDNQVLNLSPFEIRYSENRPFFTEGTELFNKGDLFYSRRVGSTPVNSYKFYDVLNTGDKIINNPSQTKLINATKVSGRTSTGLGIGFFNAITQKTEAILEHQDGTRETIETSPLTNYNILVLDQNLKNNSSVSFINSSVLRKGETYDANVSALIFNLNTKENKYNTSGGVKMSRLSGGVYDNPELGYSYNLGLGKKSGNFTYSYSFSLVDENFNPNDLGILFNNNNLDNSIYLGYSWYKATKWYNQLQTYFNANHSQRYKPNIYQSFDVESGGYVQFKNLWSMNLNLNYSAKGNDFYEARTAGRVFRSPERYGFNARFNSNRAKKISGGAYISTRKKDLFNGFSVRYGAYQNFRINNKFRIETDIGINPKTNEAGYISKNSNTGEIFFTRRDTKTIENSLEVKYTFNNKMGLNLRARHYWSKLTNKEFYILNNQGNLNKTSEFIHGLDQNFNAFNVDMIYLWRFAPGSELSIAWKDASSMFNRNSELKYFRNFDDTFNGPQNQNFSIKILYYLDYLQLRRKLVN